MNLSRSLPGDLRHVEISTQGVSLHVVQAGPDDGPLVILLHGFPEFWYGWRHQIGPLVEAGYRVWIPDQRGYHRSEKPQGRQAYHIDHLSQDIADLIDAAGCDQCHLVGHDWGGVVAWSVAERFPEKLSRLVVMNVPHIAVMLRFLTGDLRQFAKSWYILAFQFPGLPERLFSAGRFKMLRLALQDLGACSPEDIEKYVEVWSQGLTPMINWYRAALPYLFSPPPLPQIHVPTLLLWGEEDRYLHPDMGRDMIQRCTQGELKILPYAGHFIQHEDPALVNGMLLEFFGREG